MSEEVAQIQEQETPEVVPETTETAAVPEAAQPESEEQKKQGGFQRKIDKLTREKYEAQGEARALRDRIASIEQRLAGQPAAAAQQEADDPKPSTDKYESYEDYTIALTRWAARQEHKELTAKTQKEQAESQQKERANEIYSEYQERVADFVKEHDDFDQVVAKIRLSTDVGPGVQTALMEDENGPALGYYLGENPEVCQKLSELTPAKALVELGRIKARLFPESDESEDSPPPKAVAAAPAPIKPIRKASPSSFDVNDEKIPIDEWTRRRRAQLRGK